MKDVAQKEYIDCDGRFSGIYILDGEGTLNGQAVKKGDQFFIPAICEGFFVDGKMTYIQYYGPQI